jgi:integrase/recombinase XerD
LSLAVVRDLRDVRSPAGPAELAAFETDVLAGFVLAGFVLARAAAGLADVTIRSDVSHLEQVRAWFGQPLWDMEPADADAYFGKVLRVRRRAPGWAARRRCGLISCSWRSSTRSNFTR